MAAAAAVAAISGRMIPAATLDPAVRQAQHLAAPSRLAPAPATATWTTIFRSDAP
jgi:hypothetical protein